MPLNRAQLAKAKGRKAPKANKAQDTPEVTRPPQYTPGTPSNFRRKPPPVNEVLSRLTGASARSYYGDHTNDPELTVLKNIDKGCVFVAPSKIVLQIITKPGFPQPVPRPPSPVHCISPAPGMGLGMFATRRIHAMELIHGERPLAVVPVLRAKDSSEDLSNYKPEEQRKILAAEYEMKVKSYFNCMHPEAQAHYMALANAIEGHGAGPISERILINGIHFSLTNPDEPDDQKCVAVANELSRVNHSCVPNAFLTFDIDSFSYLLWSRRPIEKDEQITITYVSVVAPHKIRRPQLAIRMVDCTCEVCLNPEKWDDEFTKIFKAVTSLRELVQEWHRGNVRHSTVIYYCFLWIDKMIGYKLPYVHPFSLFVKAGYQCAVAAGEELYAHVFGIFLGHCQLLESELPVPLRQVDGFLMESLEFGHCRSDPAWATKKNSNPVPEIF